MNVFRFAAILVLTLILSLPAFGISTPEVASRTYSQNYKDMMLAGCIAIAYKKDPHASRDALDTASALNFWTDYDVENSTGKTEGIVDQYLAREYHTKQGSGKLNLLKCLDMYHSQALTDQVKKYVTNPNSSYALENRK